MTAEPLPESPSVPDHPARSAVSLWPVPPADGYTVDDLFTLPGLPPHTELIDGSLVFVSPQRDFHLASGPGARSFRAGVNARSRVAGQR
jgi:hypothetical protein